MIPLSKTRNRAVASPPSRPRSGSRPSPSRYGDTVYDWVLAGRGIMLKSQIELGADLRAGRLERVLPAWNGPTPVYALMPSARHLPIKTRVFIEAVAARLRGVPVAA